MATATKTNSDAVKARALANLGECATKYNKAGKEYKKSRNGIDACIRRSSEAGLSYREIADAVGKSLGWVQASMARSAPKE